MKKTLLLIVAIMIAGMADILPFSGTDIAKLHPIEVILITKQEGQVYIETDTGISGGGESMESALLDVVLSASGNVFLGTANYVLIDGDFPELIRELGDDFRPACQLYYYAGYGKLENIGRYLETHPSQVSLLSFRQGNDEIPHIFIDGEEYRIAGK